MKTTAHRNPLAALIDRPARRLHIRHPCARSRGQTKVVRRKWNTHGCYQSRRIPYLSHESGWPSSPPFEQRERWGSPLGYGDRSFRDKTRHRSKSAPDASVRAVDHVADPTIRSVSSCLDAATAKRAKATPSSIAMQSVNTRAGVTKVRRCKSTVTATRNHSSATLPKRQVSDMILERPGFKCTL